MFISHVSQFQLIPVQFIYYYFLEIYHSCSICTYPDTNPDPIGVSSDHTSGLLAVSSKYNSIGRNVPSVTSLAHPRVHDAIDVDAAACGPPRLLATSARSARRAEQRRDWATELRCLLVFACPPTCVRKMLSVVQLTRMR